MGHLGKQTITFKNPPVMTGAYSAVGPKELDGPMGIHFDYSFKDELFGEDTWEKAEAKLVQTTIQGLLDQTQKLPSDIQYIFAGDLSNQLMASTFGIKDFNIPFLGTYAACSTMAEAILLGSITLAGGMADLVMAGTSSHNCAAEKQFRFPVEYAGQRVETQTWTSTASGFVMLSHSGTGPKVTSVTPGKIVDLGVTDATNMGAAMAPAAVDTILMHLEDTKQKPSDFDAIITGDLGNCGVDIAIDVAQRLGTDLSGVLVDCGKMMYDDERQSTNSGGSGCGCSASIFAGYFYKQLKQGKMKKILFVPTGALLSQSSTQQGQPIPGIAHAICVEMK